MSKFDLFTINENLQAERQGWLLSYVYDLRSTRWSVQVLPTSLMVFHNAEQAGTFVVQRARTGDALAVKALQLVMAGNNPTTRKRNETPTR